MKKTISLFLTLVLLLSVALPVAFADDETCPECGGMLFAKKGRNQLVCKKDGCTFKKEAPKTETVETEEE